MESQLRLLATTGRPPADGPADGDADPTTEPIRGTRTWRLNATTREIGRRGIAQARAALHSARRGALDDRDHDGHRAA